ncbi:MAG: hypothetical protein M3395_01170 [Chloroflexota bacterium]|nr:hypothetical protein [Chloroflexota bacterium]
MKLQAQAVLRRLDLNAPLRLAGVLVAGSFYPLAPQDAWGPLHLEVGLVALAPLTPVVVTEPTDGAELAMQEARGQWSDPMATKGELLRWRPIDQVREVVADEDIRALIQQMSVANDERSGATPSTPPYHGAARELERLAARVYEASSLEERIAEDGALREKDSRA